VMHKTLCPTSHRCQESDMGRKGALFHNASGKDNLRIECSLADSASPPTKARKKM